MEDAAVVERFGGSRAEVRKYMRLKVPVSSKGLNAFLDLFEPGLVGPAHSVAEGLLLPPKDFMGQDHLVVECRTEDPLFNSLDGSSPYGGYRPCDIDELFIEERGSGFETVGGNTPVTPQDIEHPDVVKKTPTLVFEMFVARCTMEILVPSKNFVGSITVEHDLSIGQFANCFGNEPVSHRCPDGGDIVGFNIANDVGDGSEEIVGGDNDLGVSGSCLLYTSPSPRDS